MTGKLLTNVNVIWVTVVFIILQINVFCAGDCPLPYSDKLEHKDLLTKFVSGSATEGSRANLSCATRHYLDGPNTIECTNNKWVANSDDKHLRCAAIKCDNPHKIKLENGRINTFPIPGLNRSSGHYLQDSVYWVTCDKGFILKGNPVRRCMWNGTHSVWSQPADIYGEKILQGGDSPPTCEEDPNYIQYSCPDPHWLIIENGKINTFNISDHSSKDYLKDSIFWVTCDNGFKLKGYPVRRCLWNGTHGIWSRPADIYGEKLFKGGDSPPQCVPDQNFKNYSDRKNHFKVIEIIMWIFVVCYLIGFIGTAGVTCYKTIPKIKHDLQSDKKCKAKIWSLLKYSGKILILSLFHFLSPMILTYKEHKSSDKKQKRNVGDEGTEPLRPENVQMSQKINELIQKHGNLIQNIQRWIPPNSDMSSNPNIEIEIEETETLSNPPIDQLAQKHEELSYQIQQMEPFLTNWEGRYNELEKTHEDLKNRFDKLNTDNMEKIKEIQELEVICERLEDKGKSKTSEDEMIKLQKEKEQFLTSQANWEGRYNELEETHEDLKNRFDKLNTDNMEKIKEIQELEVICKRLEEKEKSKTSEEEIIKLQKENQELKQYNKENKLKHEHDLAKIDLETKLAKEKETNEQLDKEINLIKEKRNQMKGKHNSHLKLIKDQIFSSVTDLEKIIGHTIDTKQDIAYKLIEIKGTLSNLIHTCINPTIEKGVSSSNEDGALGVAGRP